MPEPVVWPVACWATMVTTDGPTLATASMIAPDSDCTATLIPTVAVAAGPSKAPVSLSARKVPPPPSTAPTREVARSATIKLRLGAGRSSAAGAVACAGSNHRSGVDPSGWNPACQGGRCSGTGS